MKILRHCILISLAETLCLYTLVASNWDGRRLEHGRAEASTKPASESPGVKDDRINYKGRDINITEAPWTVALALASNLMPFCTGTIIEPNWILTAAHCTSRFRIRPSDVVVVAGADRTKDFKNGNKTIQQKVARRMVQHPEYSGTGIGNNDVALIYVEKLLYTNSVMPMTLWDQQWAPRGALVMCQVFGWGLLSNEHDRGGSRVRSVALRKADIQAFHGECNCIRKRSTQNRVLCSHKDSVGGTCQGDSGGPLICNNTLAGVTYAAIDRNCRVSVGKNPKIPCNSPNTMNLWMYVCPMLNFISHHIPSAPGRPESCIGSRLRANFGILSFWFFHLLR